MMSDSMRHTPSRVRASGDVTVFCKIGTISPKIFSPNLRHSSVVVRVAVYNPRR